MAKSAVVAERYANALFALAQAQGVQDALAADLESVNKMSADSAELRALINSPILSRAEQRKAILALAAKAGLTDLARRFLGTLADARRLPELSAVTHIYKSKLASSRGEHTAQVTSATPLRPGQMEALRETLSKQLGGRVTLDLSVDPELLGGLVVRLGSRMMDSSLKSRLERIGFAMKGTA